VIISFQSKKARIVVPGLVSVVGNAQSPHHCLCPRVTGSKRTQNDPPPTLFDGYVPSGLFVLFRKSKSEMYCTIFKKENFK
jgi:hypothetical protein